MRIFTICATVAVLAGAASMQPARAGTMPFKTPNQLKGSCDAAGGNYSAPGTAGVYACHLKDGAVIACGGKGGFARTCESAAPRTILNPILVRGNSHETGEAFRAEPALY